MTTTQLVVMRDTFYVEGFIFTMYQCSGALSSDNTMPSLEERPEQCLDQVALLYLG
jgi:hypothetical protein